MFTKLSYFLSFLVILSLSTPLLLAKDRHERGREFRERVRERAGAPEKEHDKRKPETYREKKRRQLEEREAREKEKIRQKKEEIDRAVDKAEEENPKAVEEQLLGLPPID